jgi:hypothetical protein
MIEGVASIAELICHYYIFEKLYLRHKSAATAELDAALV